MKKNKMMRTASGLMIATLLTTGVISGTFAKYTTSDSAKDTARVAKWGVNLAVSGSLYGTDYSGSTHEVIKRETDNGATVVSSNESKVVAPGTKSNDNNGGLRISLNGSPEVSTRVYGTVKAQNIYLGAGQYGVMVAVSGITEENFTQNTYYKKSTDGTYAFADNANEARYKLEDAIVTTEKYYPVKYTNTTTKSATTTQDSLNTIALEYAKVLATSEDKVTKTEENGYTIYTVAEEDAKSYIPGDDLSEKFTDTLNDQIKWTWEYEDANDNDSDAKDTILGYMAEKEVGSTTASDVVYKPIDNGTYTAITVEGSTGLVKAANSTATDNVVACLHTGFDVSITVTQVN